MTEERKYICTKCGGYNHRCEVTVHTGEHEEGSPHLIDCLMYPLIRKSEWFAIPQGIPDWLKLMILHESSKHSQLRHAYKESDIEKSREEGIISDAIYSVLKFKQPLPEEDKCMTLNPCIVCGKQPEKIEFKSHVMYKCEDYDAYSDSFHDVHASGHSDDEAVINWNNLNICKIKIR